MSNVTKKEAHHVRGEKSFKRIFCIKKHRVKLVSQSEICHCMKNRLLFCFIGWFIQVTAKKGQTVKVVGSAIKFQIRMYTSTNEQVLGFFDKEMIFIQKVYIH